MNRRTSQQLLRFGRAALSAVSDGLARRARASGDAARSAPDMAPGRATALRDVVATVDGRPQITYTPVSDGDADPGEVVWTYVAYEDDPSQGKDRPVVVIGHLGADVAALQLTSRAHDDRHHHAVGSGAWDHEGRPSWVKLDRVLRLDPDGIRREGAILDRARFDDVVAAFEDYQPGT
ncbi:type II toxin-antitoxin system PemK/MazF family toxin [soil metagenome]